MLKRVEPLRNELQKLEDDATDNKSKGEEVERMIRDLESSISRYKEEYAILISEAQAIKADLAAVEAKVRTGLLETAVSGIVCRHFVKSQTLHFITCICVASSSFFLTRMY